MVDIISKSEFPRREDERARQLIGANRKVIEGLADRLTQGGYSQAKAAKAERARGPAARRGEGAPAAQMMFSSACGRPAAMRS